MPLFHHCAGCSEVVSHPGFINIWSFHTNLLLLHIDLLQGEQQTPAWLKMKYIFYFSFQLLIIFSMPFKLELFLPLDDYFEKNFHFCTYTIM